MKQGIHQRMRVEFDVALDNVQRVEFRFQQGATRRDVLYPSAQAERVEGQNSVDIDWTAEDTAAFRAGTLVMLDTRITMVGSRINPETGIASFYIADTLFDKEAGVNGNGG